MKFTFCWRLVPSLVGGKSIWTSLIWQRVCGESEHKIFNRYKITKRTFYSKLLVYKFEILESQPRLTQIGHMGQIILSILSPISFIFGKNTYGETYGQSLLQRRLDAPGKKKFIMESQLEKFIKMLGLRLECCICSGTSGFLINVTDFVINLSKHMTDLW